MITTHNFSPSLDLTKLKGIDIDDMIRTITGLVPDGIDFAHNKCRIAVSNVTFRCNLTNNTLEIYYGVPYLYEYWKEYFDEWLKALPTECYVLNEENK